MKYILVKMALPIRRDNGMRVPDVPDSAFAMCEQAQMQYDDKYCFVFAIIKDTIDVEAVASQLPITPYNYDGDEFKAITEIMQNECDYMNGVKERPVPNASLG